MPRSTSTAPVLALLVLAAACGAGPADQPASETGAPTAAGETGAATAAGGAEYFVSDLTAGLGLPFSEAARVGDVLFLSGMIGTRPGTLELVPGGLDAEARQTMENIRIMLAGAGATPNDVVKCTVMLDDMSQWGRFNQIYQHFFGDHRPARSAFGSDGLALGAAVEVECIAAMPPARAGSRPAP